MIFYGWRLILYGTNEQPIKITLEKSEDHNYDYIDEFIGEEDEEKQLNIINETLTGIIDQSDSSVSIGDDDATDPANLVGSLLLCSSFSFIQNYLYFKVL